MTRRTRLSRAICFDVTSTDVISGESKSDASEAEGYAAQAQDTNRRRVGSRLAPSPFPVAITGMRFVNRSIVEAV